MKICWDNLDKIKKYIPSSGIFYVGKPEEKLNNCHRYYYVDSCKACGEPFLGNKNGSKNIAEYCCKGCASSVTKLRDGNPHWNNGSWVDNEERRKSYYAQACAKRRADKLNQTPEDANQEKITVKYKMCQRLNVGAGRIAFHVDHVIPLSKGGLHHEENLRILPAFVNISKGSSIWS